MSEAKWHGTEKRKEPRDPQRREFNDQRHECDRRYQEFLEFRKSTIEGHSELIKRVDNTENDLGHIDRTSRDRHNEVILALNNLVRSRKMTRLQSAAWFVGGCLVGFLLLAVYVR